MKDNQEVLQEIEDPGVLNEKLREILVEGSLYRNFFYRGGGCHFTNNRGAVNRPRYGQLPRQLRMYCDDEKCKAQTWWDVDNDEVYFKSSFIYERIYECRNCGLSQQYYQFIRQENEHSNIFVKAGQWPPLSIEASPELAKALGEENAKLFRKGLFDFNFGHGIGAVAYFRRVLENKINALLDLIVEAAQNAKAEIAEITEIEKIKKSHRVEDRIDIASKILPRSLKPGGHNPLDKLYAPLSAGLHGESDDECLRIFSEARFVFEYLFKNLTESNDEARKYVQRLSAPTNAAKKAND